MLFRVANLAIYPLLFNNRHMRYVLAAGGVNFIGIPDL